MSDLPEGRSLLCCQWGLALVFTVEMPGFDVNHPGELNKFAQPHAELCHEYNLTGQSLFITCHNVADVPMMVYATIVLYVI